MQSTDNEYAFQYWIDESRSIFVDQEGFIRAPNNIVEGDLNIASLKGKIYNFTQEEWKSLKAQVLPYKIKTPKGLLVTGDFRLKSKFIETKDNLSVLGSLCLENADSLTALRNKKTRKNYSEIIMGCNLTVGRIFHITPKSYLTQVPFGTIAVALNISGSYTLEFLPYDMELLYGGLLQNAPHIKKSDFNIACCHKNNIKSLTVRSHCFDEFKAFDEKVNDFIGNKEDFVFIKQEEFINPDVKIWINKEHNIYLNRNNVLCVPNDIINIDLYISKLRGVGTIDTQKSNFKNNQCLEKVIISKHLIAKGNLYIKAKEIIILDGITVEGDLTLVNIKGSFKHTALKVKNKIDLKGVIDIKGIWFIGGGTYIERLPKDLKIGALILRGTRSDFEIHNGVKVIRGGVLCNSPHIYYDIDYITEMNLKIGTPQNAEKFISYFYSKTNEKSEYEYEDISTEYVEEQTLKLDFFNPCDDPFAQRFGF